ncbi:MAG: hypothetical protein AAGB16_07975 [Pseudomonadota bacterium]
MLRAPAGLLGLIGLAACGPSPAPDIGASETDIASQTSRSANLSMACSGCHSEAGGAIVSLDSYTEEMLRDAFARYKAEADGTTVMHRLARGYSDEDIDLISAYLGADGGAP